jgi:O-methyltransferase
MEDMFSDREFVEVYNKVKDFTMTSPQRLYSLYKSVEYVSKSNIPGDFVECGVWRGGSAMAIALVLKRLGDNQRRIYLYDTYEGMSEPGSNDNDIFGNSAEKLLETEEKLNNQENVWCYSTLDDVKKNLFATGYPSENLEFIKGKVEETIPTHIPVQIALLRLDTDWYESTLHEMNHLYPLLSRNGVLIIDDYGHWQGARKAIDEYLEKNKIGILLNRIDYTGRIAIKLL